MVKLIAKIVARIFDPVVEIPLILTGVISMAYLNGFRWRFFFLMFVLDALLPGLYFAWRLHKTKGKDWDIRKREERLPLFLVTTFCHGVGVMVAYFIGRHPLAEILLGLWFLAVIYALITLVWKVSIHAGVNSVLATMIVLFVSPSYWWVFLLPVIVGVARIIDDHHNPAQVITGAVIPPVFLMWFYQITGVI